MAVSRSSRRFACGFLARVIGMSRSTCKALVAPCGRPSVLSRGRCQSCARCRFRPFPRLFGVPMLVSFAAAIQGGLSFGSEITKESGVSSAREGKMAAGVGFSKLHSLFDAFVRAEATIGRADEECQTVHMPCSHTEASIAITLYDHLQAEKGYLFPQKTVEEFQDAEPGTLIKLAGVVEKNAIDGVIDFIDAVDILSNLDVSETAHQSMRKAARSPLRQIRDALDADRKRAPISNVLFRCDEPSDVMAVPTLRTANLRDLRLSELHRNTVRVVGNVTRTMTGTGDRGSV